MRSLTAIETAELLDDNTLVAANRWLAEGKGIAVYRNENFGSGLGDHKFASFGSPDAMFETTPPQQLPDTPQQINWRYQLFGVYRGRQLEPATTHDFVLPPVVLPLVLNSFENRDLLTVDNRLIAYTLEVGYQPDGIANCRISLSAQYMPPIEGEWAVITLSAPTHHDGNVDRLGPWDWLIANSAPNMFRGRTESAPLTGSDPNLGGAIVSICNLSAKKPGEGE